MTPLGHVLVPAASDEEPTAIGLWVKPATRFARLLTGDRTDRLDVDGGVPVVSLPDPEAS